jgi:hypothetical protein
MSTFQEARVNGRRWDVVPAHPGKDLTSVLEAVDIFIKMQDGTYEWKAAAESLELAKSKVKRLAAKTPGPYVIFSQTTAKKTVIPLDGAVEP